MKTFLLPLLPAVLALTAVWTPATLGAAAKEPLPDLPRPLRDLNSSYFPMTTVTTKAAWDRRRGEIRDRVMLASGLWPLPEKTPLHAVVHGRVERDDYTIDRVFFESYPGRYVTGSLYLPKKRPASMPGIVCPHGHWPDGRFMDRGAGSAATKQELATGAERWESGARSPLQARCVQLARMGCAVFHYDMIGYADSIQIPEHRSGARPNMKGKEPGTWGLYSPQADLRLQTNFGIQTWDNVRAVDFLLTIDGVDPKRLGVTGASGGGTQTMMLTAIDPRIAAAFPCVMVSTAMQGGCTCENSHYLRIGQGNIDIAAACAPRPLGMTAANDWTKELATKGFPDLQALYKMLGVKDDVIAAFNIHFPHNYNHVSRTTMYGFFNKHFKLGLPEPVLERDFIVSSKDELTVWTKEHPAPAGDAAGEKHELKLLQTMTEMSDRQLQPLLRPRTEADLRRNREVIGGAWEMIIDRQLPASSDVTFDLGDKIQRGDHLYMNGVAHYTPGAEEVPAAFVYPQNWNGTAVLWLSLKGSAALGGARASLPGEMKKLLDQGIAVACPDLYLPDAQENPTVTAQAKSNPDAWGSYAGYTYGYNPTLLARRVHDALTMVTMMKNHPNKAASKVMIAGVDGAAAIAAAAAFLSRDVVQGIAVDGGSFRFADLSSPWDVQFVPGAVKYGDLPGLLGLCAPLPLAVAGSDGLADVNACYKVAGSGAEPRWVTQDGIGPVVDELCEWAKSF